MEGRTKLITAALFAGAGLIGLLAGDVGRAYWDKSREQPQVQVPAGDIYGERPDGKTGECRQTYTKYKNTDYRLERENKEDPKIFSLTIKSREVPGPRNPEFVAVYGQDIPQLNAMLGLPPTNGRPVCHIEYLPLPIDADVSVYAVEPVQNYITALDADCDNRIESIRLWLKGLSEHGGESYSPFAIPREGSDEAIFLVAEREYLKWRQKMHVDEILAKVVGQQI